MAINARQSMLARNLASDVPGAFDPIGAMQTLNNFNTAQTLTPASLADELESQVNALLIQSSDRDIRITFDGTLPTASVGFLLPAGGSPYLILYTPSMTIRVVETNATAVVNLQWARVTG